MGAPESDLAAGCRAAPVVEPWCDSSAYYWLVFLLARFALHRQCPLTGIQLLLADESSPSLSLYFAAYEEFH